MTTPIQCERQISGVPENALCPNPAIYKVVLSKTLTYWDEDSENEYLCDTHFKAYCQHNDVTWLELYTDGWITRLDNKKSD